MILDTRIPSLLKQRFPNGLVPKNNTGSPNTVLDITAGDTWDDTFSDVLVSSGGTIDLATNGLNGLDTGSIAANQTYFLYIIKNPTTLVTGFLASLSISSPTLPSGFTLKREIGAWTTNASSQLRPYRTQGSGEIVTYSPLAPIASVDVTNLGTSATTYTITDAPNGKAVEAVIEGRNSRDGSVASMRISALDTTNIDLNTNLIFVNIGNNISGHSGPNRNGYRVSIYLNSSRQFRARSLNSGQEYSAILVKFDYNRSI
jgi:3D (Asp-Asp-Asp) domain-containing protein